MSARRFALVIAPLFGTPLFAAFVLATTRSTPAAVAVCLVVAAVGLVGAVLGTREILRWAREREEGSR